jgi:lysophospholipid acyltransferase (LPLAT)-like uncharacterized protein
MKIKFKYRMALLLLNLFAFTWRIVYKGNEPTKKGIVVFWHGFMLPGWFAFKNTEAAAVISQSKDGEILSYLLTDWGFDFIRGSSSKGGKEVLQQIVEQAKGKWILMTPDGPRGPKKEMKAGAIVAAHRAQVPLYLCGIKVFCKYTFKNSWDNFVLPIPFSKIEISYSKPIHIDKNMTKEEISNTIEKIETSLNNLYQ